MPNTKIKTTPKKPAKPAISKAAPEAKKRLFVEAYLTNGMNATEAAIAAGYAKSGASVQGCRMLRNDKVKAILEERTKKTMGDLSITTIRILQERARLAFFDPRKLFNNNGQPIPIHELDEDTAAGLAGLDIHEEYEGSGESRVFTGYTKKYKLSDKNASLTALEKINGMYILDNEQNRPEIRVLVIPAKAPIDI